MKRRSTTPESMRSRADAIGYACHEHQVDGGGVRAVRHLYGSSVRVGAVHVRARVGNGTNAVTERAKAHVTATPPDDPIVQCPTGDSLLDLPASRASLRELARRTDSPTPKVEWAGYVYQLPNGRYRLAVDTVASHTCAGSYASKAAPLGWSHVLLTHSHPGAPKQLVCGGKAVVGSHKGLFSPNDWDAADTRQHLPPVVPVAVIDPKQIAIAETGVWDEVTGVQNPSTGGFVGRRTPSKAQFDSNYSQFNRKEPLCLRP